jgi:site-specific recombinase XerD
MPTKKTVRTITPELPESLSADVDNFEFHLLAEGKAPKTCRTYLDAIRWFGSQLEADDWSEVTRRDIQAWIIRLRQEYSDSYANQQYRALQQFWKWWSESERADNPMWGMKPPKIRPKLVPILADDELDKLIKAARGKGFRPRRDTAIISLFKDTGVRLAELAGLTLDDVDLKRREATVTGKAGKQRIVKFTAATALLVGQYLKVRAKHRRAESPRLWLGIQGPMTPHGVYQAVKRIAAKAGVQVHPHQFRHTFSHVYLDNGGEEGDLVELNGWETNQMLKIYGKSAASTRARRSYDRVMSGKGA